jgi:16S rRNA (guanine(966)-N(2))-methyltransferase RsmD
MRIIAGEKRGLVLKSPKVANFRPTLGRARESIFGILTPVIPDARVLDLFAGTGALGLEAPSRGASSVLFVEMSRPIARAIEENIAKTGYTDRCRLVLGDVFRVVKKVASAATFDLVFADPPYLREYPQKVLELVMEGDLLSEEGLLILEMHKREVPILPETGLELIREKKYGATIVWILRRGH